MASGELDSAFLDGLLAGFATGLPNQPPGCLGQLHAMVPDRTILGIDRGELVQVVGLDTRNPGSANR